MSDLVEVVRAPLTPLRLFADEAAHRDGQATEALFLSFNVDLSFLESRLLDLCRQAGARVTVVADADVWAPDVRAITLAGVRYHVGLVAANGAFHPKVSVIVGPKRAVAIIGSGNLGMGGWQSNAELATVMTATLEAAPLAMRDLRDLLATLAERPELEPTSTSAIQRSVSQLTELLTNTAELVDTGHRVAASWDQPLIEQIPQGAPVRELWLSAAFHDRGSIAVRRLLERLQPLHVRVAIQPGQTVIDPAALVRVLDDYSSSGDAEYEVLVDRESRYRHGKLIEWTVDGARMTLTGSPNLSQAALLGTPPSGNFEVAVIAPTSMTLFPGGESTERPAEIPARAGLAPGEGMSGCGPVIVSAVLTHDALSVRFARLSRPIIVEISAFADPDIWRALTPVPANQLTVELPPNCMGGDRVRLAWTDEVGVEWRSSPVYVTDRLSVERRPLDRTHDPKMRNAALTDLWGEDLSFLQSVFDELQAFTEGREGIARGREKPNPAPGHATAPQHAVRQDSGTWLWLREQSVDVLGPAIGPYALGLPPLASGTRGAAPDWTDVLTVDEEADLDAEVDQEEDDAREGAPEPIEAPPDHTESPLAVRRARRRWCVKAASIALDTAIQYRLLLLRLTLRLWVLGNWDEGDLEPVRLIARLTSALRDEDGEANSPELNTRIGSLAAVSLILVRPKEIKDSGEQLDLYRRLRDDVADLLVAGEDQAIEAFFDGLIDEGDLEVKMHDARGLIEDAMGGDYLGELERDLFLDDATKEVRRPAQNLLHLVADVPRARLEHRALELVGRVENHLGVGIWVSNLEDDWVLAAWNVPELIRVAPYPNGSLRWRYHRLRALVTPSSIAFEDSHGQKPELGPSRTRKEAEVALTRIGVTDPVPPGMAPATHAN